MSNAIDNMHELNICLNILHVLESQAKQHHFRRIKTLWLEIGDLANIELDALRFNFPIAAAKSVAKNASLEIITVEGRAWCVVCQKNVTLRTHLNPCSHCGQYNYQITQGKELRIIKMEVE